MSNSGKKIHTRPHSTAVSGLAFVPMSLGRVWQGNRSTALIATGWDVPMNSAAKICTIRAERLLGKTSMSTVHLYHWLNRSSTPQCSYWTLVCGVPGWLQAHRRCGRAWGWGTPHATQHPAGKGWHSLEHFVPEDASGNILPRSHGGVTHTAATDLRCACWSKSHTHLVLFTLVNPQLQTPYKPALCSGRRAELPTGCEHCRMNTTKLDGWGMLTLSHELTETLSCLGR